MTTFTLGLGVSGYMQFQSNYRTATSGDFFDVTGGHAGQSDRRHLLLADQRRVQLVDSRSTTARPNIDDLWHAAVNGRGTYFSASDPVGLYTGLSGALAQIETQKGAAAAATTSNPNVSAGDNFVFISRFTVAGVDRRTGRPADQRRHRRDLEAGIDWSAQARLDAQHLALDLHLRQRRGQRAEELRLGQPEHGRAGLLPDCRT